MSSASADGEVEWEDVTDFLLNDVTKEMHLGQMICSEKFSLHDSMSALELMDAKMDPGMNGEDIMTVAKAIKGGTLPTKLSIFQVLSIMDKLMCCEVTWLQGNSIGHTFFTCLLLHRPELISDPILTAFVDCLLKTTDTTWTSIYEADIYEEEDFYPTKFKFNLRESMTTEEVFDQLASAQQTVETALETAKNPAPAAPSKKAGKKKKGSKKKSSKRDGEDKKSEGASSSGSLQDDPDQEAKVCEAVLLRLKLRRVLLDMHMQFKSIDTLSDALATATEAKALIEQIQETCPFGSWDDVDIGSAFDSTITQVLIPNQPPRKVTMASPEATAQFHLDLFVILNHLEALPSLKGFDMVLNFAQHFSALRPNIVARSYLLYLFGSAQNFLGTGPLTDRMVKSMITHSYSLKHITGADSFPKFVPSLGQSTSMLLRLLCANRARQQRRAPTMLPEWFVAQQQANICDQMCRQQHPHPVVTKMGAIQPYKHPIYSWTCEQTVRFLTHYILLGFELQIYLPREVPILYWSLEYLCNVRLDNRNQAFRPAPGTKKRAPILAPVPSAEFALVETYMHLSVGVMLLSRALSVQGVKVELVPQEAREYWFKQRWLEFVKMPFHRQLTAADFETSLRGLGGDPIALLERAGKSFASAKKSLSLCKSCDVPLPAFTAPRIQSLAKVAVCNSLAIFSIKKQLKLDIPMPKDKKKKKAHNSEMLRTAKGFKIQYDFSVGKQFPIISLASIPERKRLNLSTKHIKKST